ncbi:9672_t:CDS:2 [Entrophospora sp. SA101]|nr:9672_t:CDS:2 [Entrophospora sp. SA101]
MIKKLLNHNKLISLNKTRQNLSNSVLLLSLPDDHFKQLENLVEKLGENWDLVSKYMFTKSPVECYKKYAGLLNILPDHHTKNFKHNDNNDDLLLPLDYQHYQKEKIKQLENLVEKLGENWDLVSKYMFTKSPVECYKKYAGLLNILPDHHTKNFKHNDNNDDLLLPLDYQHYQKEKSWKEEEIKSLNNLFEIHGRRWNKIIKHFPNKSSSEIELFVKKNPDKFPSLSNSIHDTSSIRWPNVDLNILNNTISTTTIRPTTTNQDHLPWTKHEINLLNELVEKYGQNWFKISSKLPGRSAILCEFKYHQSWNQMNNDVTSISEHHLSKEVIDAFNLLVKKYGRWQLIPLLLPGFTPLCFNSPRTRQWSSEDKKFLKNIIAEHGFDWDKIIPSFPYKKPNEVRQHVFKYFTKYHPHNVVKKSRKSKLEVKWGVDDIYQLFKLRLSGKDFTEISQKLKPKRTPLACYVRFYYITRYYESLNTNWSLIKVVKLQYLYNKYGNNWKLIAKPSHNDQKNIYWPVTRKNWSKTDRDLLKDLLKKYGNDYGHDRKRIMWSSDEIKKLVDLVRIYSGKWDKVSEIMKNRSSDACSRKYYTIINPEGNRNQSI